MPRSALCPSNLFCRLQRFQGFSATEQERRLTKTGEEKTSEASVGYILFPRISPGRFSFIKKKHSNNFGSLSSITLSPTPPPWGGRYPTNSKPTPFFILFLIKKLSFTFHRKWYHITYLQYDLIYSNIS